MADQLCDNCSAVLMGPYCSVCGQHAHASARTLRALLHDALHDLTHFEGRVWMSLRLLLTQPGRLTQEYFSGRRTRFAPPFRLYLVLSVLFFALSSIVAHVDPEPVRAVGYTAPSSDAPHEKAEDCTDIHMDSPSRERLVRQLCERVSADGGRSVSHTFESYVPKAMFVFLPLVAAALALIYRRTRRYYVEHLVLVIHNHAAAFAMMSIARLLHLLSLGLSHVRPVHTAIDSFRGAFDVGVFVYVLWYTYRSLRRYYGVSRSGTTLRLIPLGIAYLVCLGLTFGATLLLSATLT